MNIKKQRQTTQRKVLVEDVKYYYKEGCQYYRAGKLGLWWYIEDWKDVELTFQEVAKCFDYKGIDKYRIENEKGRGIHEDYYKVTLTFDD